MIVHLIGANFAGIAKNFFLSCCIFGKCDNTLVFPLFIVVFYIHTIIKSYHYNNTIGDSNWKKHQVSEKNKFFFVLLRVKMPLSKFEANLMLCLRVRRTSF